MTDCEYIAKCPIFAQCQSGVIEGVFGTMYCKGHRLEDCERRKLKKAGKDVPPNLLPNGKSMSSIGSC